MQYDVDSPEAYLTHLEPDWRKEKLEALREMILKQDNAITECIEYKMLCFRLNDSTLFHLNAQKAYVSLYCGDTTKVDEDGTLLKGLNVGKGCIRFTKSKALSKTQIETFIEKAVSLCRTGLDLSC